MYACAVVSLRGERWHLVSTPSRLLSFSRLFLDMGLRVNQHEHFNRLPRHYTDHFSPLRMPEQTCVCCVGGAKLLNARKQTELAIHTLYYLAS